MCPCTYTQVFFLHAALSINVSVLFAKTLAASTRVRPDNRESAACEDQTTQVTSRYNVQVAHDDYKPTSFIERGPLQLDLEVLPNEMEAVCNYNLYVARVFALGARHAMHHDVGQRLVYAGRPNMEPDILQRNFCYIDTASLTQVHPRGRRAASSHPWPAQVAAPHDEENEEETCGQAHNFQTACPL